ncbi:response regulator transcription factor [Zoogloea dura]|uniref:Response regulator transcription factor n=1 Tax=Zoogloea dura TaxID=2728840 RepID=A0A848GAB2_9RHOO|nr:response regulator [Zoogloea dura]NML28224.1 response regulator transcription factor [Zoogloea dura]
MTASPDMPMIHVVDDEAPFRRSLLFLLESVGWQAAGHESAEAFLAAAPAFPAAGGCIVLDIRMPRLSGLELQRRLLAAGSMFPVIFMTGHGDVELAVQAMKDGALDFLQKPFKDQLFLDAVERAVQVSVERHAAQRRQDEALEVLTRLSAREREVARLLALGLANKEVARLLGISDNTVHVHRQHVMDKTGTGSAADLARLILRADPEGLD